MSSSTQFGVAGSKTKSARISGSIPQAEAGREGETGT
jgi:hypothetical protein